MTRSKNIKTLVSALALAALAGTGHAQSLVGDTVTIEGLGFTFGGQSTTTTVGDGVEFTLSSGNEQYDIDVDATGITMTARYSGGLVQSGWTDNSFGDQVRGFRVSGMEFGSGYAINGVSVSGSAFNLDDGDFVLTGDTIETVRGSNMFATLHDTTVRIELIPEVRLVSNATQGTMHATLQDALNNASSGDAIEIAAGTLFEDNIVFPSGLDVTITGAGEDQTFIDGGMGATNTPIFNMVGTGQSNATIISSLTLQNGVQNSGSGGGAVRLSGTSPEFSHVQFLDNVGTIGGHVLANASQSRFDQCTFRAGTGLGAVADGGSSNMVYSQCLFLGMAAVDSFTSTATLVNCTVSSTSNALRADSGSQINATGCVLDGSLALLGGSISTSHSLYPGATASNGNIAGVPTFVDAANGDYRLAPGSLGIDAADYDAFIAAGGGAYDLAGDWRRHDHAAANTGVGAFAYLDMGAYETSALANDCNGNGVDDSADLATQGAHTDFDGVDGHLPFFLNANEASNPLMENGSVRLTEIGVQGQLATAVFDPQLSQPVDDFVVSFDAQFIHGTGWGADGISFAVLDKAAHTTGALFGETGPDNNALVVRIHEYVDQTVEIVADGVVLDSATVPVDLNDGNWHHFLIERSSGVITVTLTPWGGQPVVLATGADITPYDALYGFGSRTGADTNEHRIDNVRFEAFQNNDANSNGTPDDCETLMACSPADVTTDGTANGVPDGAVTLSDFSYYLSLWSAAGPTADLTAEGACNLGTGEGAVTLSDFSCYLSTWSQGCP